jgi:DNA-binding protein HU-beta
MTISRKDLVRQVAIIAEMKTADAECAVDAVFCGLANGLIQRSKIRIPGFGTFKVAHRAASEGRNPKTQEPAKIPARDAAKFVPAKALKEALNPPPSVPRRRSA